MNFKTTITLLVVLAAVGIYLFVSRSSPPETATSPAAAKKVLDLKPEDVTQFSIAAADGKTTAFQKAAADWKITEPMQVTADASQVDSLLRDILGTESRGQVPASDKASNGLDHPAYTVTLVTRDQTQKLLVGDKPPLGDTLAVMVDGQSQPQVVDVSLFSKLSKKSSAYRKTRLVEATTDKIRQLEIARGKQTIRLEKTGAEWQMTAPRKMPADSSAVESLLFALTGFNASSFDDATTPADAGLIKPRATVWFSTEAPSTQPSTAPATRPAGTTIKFGGYEDVTDKNLYASVDDGPIALVSASTLDSFKKSPLELRDKSVLNIDPDRVVSFTLNVERPPATQPATGPSTTQSTTAPSPIRYTLERRKEERALGPVLPTTASSRPTTLAATQPASKWIFAGGAPADDLQVKTLLDALHPLKAEKFLEQPAPATRPAATYTITLQAGPGAGSPPGETTLTVTDPGKDQKLIGAAEDLTFELDRALATTLDASLTPKK